jgi:hypothetical protein
MSMLISRFNLVSVSFELFCFIVVFGGRGVSVSFVLFCLILVFGGRGYPLALYFLQYNT